jgi:hypothetical protein
VQETWNDLQKRPVSINLTPKSRINKPGTIFELKEKSAARVKDASASESPLRMFLRKIIQF